MFGFKKNEGIPDVGQEEEYERKNAPEKFEDSSAVYENEPVVEQVGPHKIVRGGSSNVQILDSGLEVEKLNAKIEAISSWIKQFYERFSVMSESIGSVRNMGITNERNIATAIKNSTKAIEMVEEVQPQRLGMDYKKLEAKIAMLYEKIEGNKQFYDTVMEEFREIKKKSEVFIGTDELLKLNADVSRDLVEAQKMAAKVELNTDKSEDLFIELKKAIVDMKKVESEISDFNNSKAELDKMLHRISMDYSKLTDNFDIFDLKKSVNRKFEFIKMHSAEIKELKKRDAEMSYLIEKILDMSKKNKGDIKDLSKEVGLMGDDEESSYAVQLNTLTELIENLAVQVNEIKMKLKIKTSKVSLPNKVKPKYENEEKELEEKAKKLDEETEDVGFFKKLLLKMSGPEKKKDEGLPELDKLPKL